MRALVELAVRRRVTVIMAALAAGAFGLVGFLRLSLELFPDIAYPSVTIQTDLADTAPEEVEDLITRPVEEAVGVLSGLQTIHSVSRSGTCEVTLEFDWGTDMDLMSMEVREKLDRIILPEDAEKPIVMRFDPSLDPIMRLSLSGDDELTELRDRAERRIKQDFETIKGVAAAQVKGGLEKEIQIEVDQERLAALGIPLERIRQVVGVSNVNLPGGLLRGKHSQYLIRTRNEFDSLERIRNLRVWRNEDAFVRLKEVARVFWGAREREEITRVNGKESVEIALYKEGDANTVTVAREIDKRLREWQEEKLPEGNRLEILFDQSGFIEQAVNEVRNAALVGGVLAILVLFAFLRERRSTLIVATSIPLSVIVTFLVMYLADISLNIMSLGGLTLGIGMLVDNSIVVLESIYRKRQEGLGLARAAVQGTTDVGPAVVASTLTTVAVFLPIVFVKGVAGQLFRDQALTVTISLLASLVVAVTMIPMLSAIGVRAGQGTPAAAATGNPAPARTLGAFSGAYDRLLRGAIRLRWLTLVVAFGLFALSMYSLRWIGTELIPPLSEGEFYFEVNMPEGTSLQATDEVVRAMEGTAVEDRSPGRDGQPGTADDVPTFERTYSTVGSRLVAGGMSLNTRGEHLGQVNLVLRDRSDSRKEEQAIQRLRDQFLDFYDLEVKFGRPSYFSLRTPIEVVIHGDDLDDLRVYSMEVARALGTIPGLVDVRSSLEAGNPELQVKFDRPRLASMGLEMGVLSETLKNRVQGVVPTRFREKDRQIDIRIRNVEDHRSSVRDVLNLVIPGSESTPIRLLTVADVYHDLGPAEIHRLGQQRAAVITANLHGRSLGSAIAEVKETLETLPPGPGLEPPELGGQNREMEVSFGSLREMLALAIFMVYVVMASIFESFLHPLLVLFTIPLSLLGVVAGLLATGATISVIVFIGTVMLVGIVVNNAIILIDTVNRLRRAGVKKLEAVVRAGHIRLRPIIMTTVTTILGLLPMALMSGEGSELRSPLAITVASGLFLSTLLTLVVIPAAYMAVPSRVAPVDPGDGEEDGEEDAPAGAKQEGGRS